MVSLSEKQNNTIINFKRTLCSKKPQPQPSASLQDSCLTQQVSEPSLRRHSYCWSHPFALAVKAPSGTRRWNQLSQSVGPSSRAGEGNGLTKLQYKAKRQRMWIPNLTHSTSGTDSVFLYEVTMKNNNAYPGTAVIILWKRCNTKDLSADNKHGIIYICSVKAWKQLNKISSILSIFR